MAISTACAIHCAVLPVVAGILPVIGLHHFADDWEEWMLIAVTAIVGVTGHVSAYTRHHHHLGPAITFVASLLVIIGARLTLGDTLLEPAALAIGGLAAAAAHWMNIHVCRCCSHHPLEAAIDECATADQSRGGHGRAG
jgi:hypothetical protein